MMNEKDNKNRFKPPSFYHKIMKMFAKRLASPPPSTETPSYGLQLYSVNFLFFFKI